MLTLTFIPQLILADSFDPYKLVYERCLVFNPGSFHRRRFQWSTYHPHMTEIKERMEERCVPVYHGLPSEPSADAERGLAASCLVRTTDCLIMPPSILCRVTCCIASPSPET